jgi:PLP dependent protein
MALQVSEKLTIVQQNIKEACKKVGRSPNEIKIIAVTKYVSLERAKEALEAGIVHLGENRDEGVLEKWGALKNEPIWHFIGTLQTRKVKNIIDKVSYIHSLDRISLAQEIHRRASYPISCFIQVNVSGEDSKHGIPSEYVIEFIQNLKELYHIRVIGLMTMAPLTKDEEIIRNSFQGLKELQQKVQSLKLDYAPCHELSMGMSNDYQIAVEEGATFVRIGTSLVG